MILVSGPFIVERDAAQRRADQLSASSRSIERSEAILGFWPYLGHFRAVSLYSDEGFGDVQGACGDSGLMYRVTRG